MSGFLLDVNVLVALLWPDHTFHELVQAWFGKNASRGWTTCPITQAGFVRIVSNPAFSVRAVSPSDALRALDLTLRHPAHQFWPDDVLLSDAVKGFESRLVGHQQITDAYLLGLAIHKKGRLATLDRSVIELFGRGDPRASAVELISGKG
jgi:toxin-antitoxin system PIN domain toxin